MQASLRIHVKAIKMIGRKGSGIPDRRPSEVSSEACFIALPSGRGSVDDA
jgi:hypothetical protein